MKSLSNKTNRQERQERQGTNPKWFFLALLASLALLAVHSRTSDAQIAPTTRPTLWLVGDSTVRNGSGNGGSGQWGWGDRIARYFDPAKTSVVNAARGGRSSRTFITEGLWDKVLADARPGDFVIIQLGHNDGGPLAGDNRERGSLRDIGDETEDVTLTLPPREGEKETVHTYGWYLRKYVADARARGMTPILCSPVPRRPKSAVGPATKPLTYALWAQQVAEAEHVPFVDLNRTILSHYAAMTPEQIKAKYFTSADDTHTNADGADLNAACVVEALGSLADDPLRPFLADSTQTRSFKLPEGNYNVTVTLGSPASDATTTVLAEQRRLMVERLHTGAGESVQRTFTVNVRTPDIPGDGKVKLNAREASYPNWDDQLTLQFLGDAGAPPAARDIDIRKADDAITVYLAGDSTVTDQANEPYNSWGQMLPRFFKAGVAVANYAESGRSLRSFKAERRLDKILTVIRSGDYLFIQFGHNDMKEKGEGVGAFTTFKRDLEHYVEQARQRGAHPVLLTPMNRRRFDGDGKIVNTHGDYPEAVWRIAREQNLPLIDLHAMSKPLYEAWGPEQSPRAFAPMDNTHHNNYGSYELARCVVEGIRQNNLELVRFLADDVGPFDPAHPDPMDEFRIPAAPRAAAPTTKPEGS
jgi:lysophospholipase L1-like esterase